MTNVLWMTLLACGWGAILLVNVLDYSETTGDAKTHRRAAKAVYAIAVMEIFVILAICLSGCTPYHAHRIWDGYEIRDGWATSQETTP